MCFLGFFAHALQVPFLPCQEDPLPSSLLSLQPPSLALLQLLFKALQAHLSGAPQITGVPTATSSDPICLAEAVGLEARSLHCPSCCDPTMLTIKPSSISAQETNESHWLQ